MIELAMYSAFIVGMMVGLYAGYFFAKNGLQQIEERVSYRAIKTLQAWDKEYRDRIAGGMTKTAMEYINEERTKLGLPLLATKNVEV